MFSVYMFIACTQSRINLFDAINLMEPCTQTNTNARIHTRPGPTPAFVLIKRLLITWLSRLWFVGAVKYFEITTSRLRFVD